MAFLSTIKGLWTLDETLEEETSAKDLVNVSSSGTYASFQTYDIFNARLVTRSGLNFEDGVYFQTDDTIDLTNDGHYHGMIAFWWYSPLPLGLGRHPTTRKITPIFAPIVAKGQSSTSDSFEQISGEWAICEVGTSKTKNAIRFYLCSTNSTPTHIVQSIDYLPGLHHIAVQIEKTNGVKLLRIDIDGNPGTSYLGPSNMTTTTSPLQINRIGVGYTANKKIQEGAILGDLVIKSGVTNHDPIKMIRFGVNAVATTQYMNTFWSFNSFAFAQPSTVTTNQIFVKGGSIYAARSNGELLKGNRPIWDAEYTFSTPASVSKLTSGKNLDICPADENKSTICWTNDGITIERASIKL